MSTVRTLSHLTIHKKRQPRCSFKKATRLSFRFWRQDPWLSDPAFQRVWLFQKRLSITTSKHTLCTNHNERQYLFFGLCLEIIYKISVIHVKDIHRQSKHSSQVTLKNATSGEQKTEEECITIIQYKTKHRHANQLFVRGDNVVSVVLLD